MTWTQAGTIQITRDWQYTEPIAEGSYFRLKHTEAPNGGLFAIAQCEVDSDGKLSIGDSQILAVEKGIDDIVKLPRSAYTNRRIAIKKVTAQPSLEQEIRRLFLPNFLMPLEQEINYIRRNNWQIDIEVSDYAEASTENKLPTPKNTQLNYESNGDEKGVFYHLGIDGATRNNPQISGAILLSASSRAEGSLENIVDRTTGMFATGGNPNEWVKVDLKTKKLKCNYYSIKGWMYSGDLLRNWNFQGSNDETNWENLDIQTNNQVGQNAWYSKNVNTTTFYRYFRILSTGPNSNGSFNLTLSEWELYGELS